MRLKCITLFSLLLTLFILSRCSKTKPNSLLKTIDSIASLPTPKKEKPISLSKADSLYSKFVKLNIQLDKKNFKKFIKAIREDRQIPAEYFSLLFPEWAKLIKDKVEKDISPTVFILSADSSKMAISLDDPLQGESEVYLIGNYTLLASFIAHHVYSLTLKSFVNENGETIVYSRNILDKGTGLWWSQFFFYSITNTGAKPVLNQLENAILTYPWSLRNFEIKSDIIQTAPLKIHYHFTQAIYDTTKLNLQQVIVSDSAIITFNWQKEKSEYVPDFTNSKLNAEQFRCFSLASSDYLFIKAYAEAIKINLKDDTNRKGLETFVSSLKPVSLER